MGFSLAHRAQEKTEMSRSKTKERRKKEMREVCPVIAPLVTGLRRLNRYDADPLVLTASITRAMGAGLFTFNRGMSAIGWWHLPARRGFRVYITQMIGLVNGKGKKKYRLRSAGKRRKVRGGDNGHRAKPSWAARRACRRKVRKPGDSNNGSDERRTVTKSYWRETLAYKCGGAARLNRRLQEEGNTKTR